MFLFPQILSCGLHKCMRGCHHGQWGNVSQLHMYIVLLLLNLKLYNEHVHIHVK